MQPNQRLKVLALSGIADSESFHQMIVDNNLNIVKKLSFSDHHKYCQADIDNIKNQNIDYINKELNKLHPSDSAEVISNLSEHLSKEKFEVFALSHSRPSLDDVYLQATGKTLMDDLRKLTEGLQQLYKSYD